MKALDRYIFVQLATTTLATALALTLMVWLTQSLRLFDYIVNRGLPAETFLLLAALLMPSFLTVVLPVAVFVSALFIYNKLTTESELIVMRACGMSPAQVARPALLAGLLVTLVMFLITLYVLPTSFRNFKDLQHDIRTNYSSVLLQEGVFTEIDDSTVIYISGRTPEGQLLDILVHDTREPEQPTTIMAEVAEIVGGTDGPVLVLYNGQRQQFDRGNQSLSNLNFDRYALELASTAGGEREWREPSERYLHEIFGAPYSELDEKYRGELTANGHQRLVMPLYVPAFVMLAMAPFLLGEFSRRGYWKRVLVVVVAVAVLQVQLLALEDLVSGNLALVPLMYAGVLLPNATLAWLLFMHKPRRRHRLTAQPA